MTACGCQKTVYEVEGERVEGIVRVDPDCRFHGIPEQWPPLGSLGGLGYLYRHARWIETDRERLPSGAHERRVVITERLETPREVEARLLTEMRGAA